MEIPCDWKVCSYIIFEKQDMHVLYNTDNNLSVLCPDGSIPDICVDACLNGHCATDQPDSTKMCQADMCNNCHVDFVSTATYQIFDCPKGSFNP